MNKGFLSQYFEAVAAKRLSEVEANPEKSHQHEFNGSKGLQAVLGINNTGEKIYFNSRLIWMGEENESVTTDCKLSWYDSRFDVPGRLEWRLYFPTTDVTGMMKAGDLMFVAKRPDGSVMVIIVAAGSTVENQLLWLFDVPVQKGRGFVYQDLSGDNREVDFAVRFILEELGIDVEEPETDYLDSLLERFKSVFPKTKELSLLHDKPLEM